MSIGISDISYTFTVMREVAFIQNNKDKWQAFEQVLIGKGNQNPDELAQQYIQLINDLAYAQTFYPKSKTVVYLNHLASRAYQNIYTTKRADKDAVKRFFTSDVPLLMHKYKVHFYFALCIFLVSVGIGVLSAAYDDSFARIILGDEYIELTLDNIAGGDPVAIYKSGSNWGSFIGITANNLYVGIKCYTYGITAGIGTLYVAFTNGIMLGTFQTFFAQHNVLWESVQGIWIHGAMEIFTIIIEITCGFILAASMLFPNTLSRIESFKIGVRESFKIWVSTLPFTVFAGFLEGFVTRFSNVFVPFVNITIIVATLSFIVWYYVIYPSRFRRDEM
ncbi:MAG: stage II sporulation protein M [Saprospiraceae bacterium]|nr:stage II sporulation protein M [Saprospiraceae bacterium]